jgi:four helix bundle protein
MRDHTKLRAFELADEVAVLIYEITKDFPKEEMFGLTAQMRKAAVSIPSNIVEGCTRSSQADYLRFLEIAFGSLRELHYQTSLSNRLGYIRNHNYPVCEEKLSEAGKVLAALIRSLRSKPSSD